MKRLSRYILYFVSCGLLLLPKQLTKACGFMVYPGEYRFWLLQPDISNRPSLTPFFFATTYLYHDTYNLAVEESYDLNVNEWYLKMKGRARKADIDSLLYSTDSEGFLYTLNSLKSTNSFARLLLELKNKQLLDYILLTKQVESAINKLDPWEEQKFPDENISRIIDSAESLYQRYTDSFIRLRTAFHLMRLYRVNKSSSKTVETYEKRIASVKSDSWIKAAALYQKAQVSAGIENSYLYSRVFDQGIYRRVYCLTYFDSKNYEEVLDLAKNNHERTVIYAMKVLNERGKSLPLIKRIYNYEPAYKELPFILLREINKLEDWLETSKLSDFLPATADDPWEEREVYWKEHRASDLAYAKEVYAFLVRIINENLHPETSLLRIYASHLSLILGDLSQSRMHLELAKGELLSRSVLTQLRISEVLLGILENPRFTKSTEDKLMAIINTPNEELGITDPGIMKDQLLLFAGTKLIQKGDRVPGFLMLSRTRRALGELSISTYKKVDQVMWECATVSDYDAIIEILDKKNKSAFEQFTTNGYHSSPLQYYEYYDNEDSAQWDKSKLMNEKASLYIRTGNLDTALSILRQIPDSFWHQWPFDDNIGGNPYFVDLNNPDPDREKESINCNKREIIEGMLSLERLAKTDSLKAAQYYFELANAWYNMSYHGKNWLMVKQWRSMSDLDDAKRTPFNDFYYGNVRAKQYYIKALKAARNKELASFSCYMAGECQDDFETYLEAASTQSYFRNNKNPYLKYLKTAGYDTEYYNELIEECATYHDFISKYNRWKNSP